MDDTEQIEVYYEKFLYIRNKEYILMQVCWNLKLKKGSFVWVIQKKWKSTVYETNYSIWELAES